MFENFSGVEFRVLRTVSKSKKINVNLFFCKFVFTLSITGRIKKLYVLVVQRTSKRWAVKPGVNTATSGDHRVSVLKVVLVIQVKRHLLLEQNAKEIFTSSYQASNYWKSKIITIITLSRYSLFQKTFKRVHNRVLQCLNPNLKFRAIP